MAIQNITYDNKSYINQNANIPLVNKVSDTDMNEIKSVVNNNASELTGLANQFGDFITEVGGDSATNFYIKYNSGILIQYGTLSTNVAMTTAMGSVFRSSNTITKNFAVSFYDNKYYLTTTAYSAINSFYLNPGGKTVSSFDGYPIAYTSTSGATRYIDFIAIGRWKE